MKTMKPGDEAMVDGMPARFLGWRTCDGVRFDTLEAAGIPRLGDLPANMAALFEATGGDTLEVLRRAGKWSPRVEPLLVDATASFATKAANDVETYRACDNPAKPPRKGKDLARYQLLRERGTMSYDEMLATGLWVRRYCVTFDVRAGRIEVVPSPL